MVLVNMQDTHLPVPSIWLTSSSGCGRGRCEGGRKEGGREVVFSKAHTPKEKIRGERSTYKEVCRKKEKNRPPRRPFKGEAGRRANSQIGWRRNGVA